MYTVLYVDDEETLLEVGKLFLERDGRFSIDTITSAPSALALMEKKNYDAIISDYQMPLMDGIAFLKRVRGANNPVPFILFTGRGREEIVIQALNEGADFYLQKGGEPAPQFAELAHKVRLAVEQRRAEASIRDHERREQDIINFLPDATFAIDMNGTVIAWNRAIEVMTGVPAKEMLGKGGYEYAIPFYGERRPILINLIFVHDDEIRSRYSDIVHDGTMLAAETTLSHLKGEQRTVWARATPLYDQGGHVVGAIETIRDITARKAAETELRKAHDELEERVNQRTADLYAANMQLHKEIASRKVIDAALQESEERYRTIVEKDYRSILENIQDVFYRTDAEGNLVLVSPSGVRLLGYASVDEVLGRPASSFYADPGEREAFLAELKKYGSVANAEATLRQKDGTTVTVSTSSHVRYDAGGNYAGVEGIFRDITRLRQVQENLRESEEQYRVLVSHIQDGAFLSQDGLLIYCNQAFADMVGYAIGDVTGMPIPDLVAPEDREMVMGRQRARLAGKNLQESYGFRLLHRDGTTRIPVMMSVGIGTYRNRPAVIGTLRDQRKDCGLPGP